jgi:hypothetical protein
MGDSIYYLRVVFPSCLKNLTILSRNNESRKICDALNSLRAGGKISFDEGKTKG